MNITIEDLIFDYGENMKTALIDLINRIILANNLSELRYAVRSTARRTDLTRYFYYGYGRHHFWLKQRSFNYLSKGDDMRIMIVRF